LKGLDRQFWLAVLFSALVIVPRAAMVAHAQSEGFDDEYHLSRGLDFWHRDLQDDRLNDPPLGEAISAIPLLVTGCHVPDDGHVLYGQRLSVETLLLLVAIWKSILFLPLVGLAFEFLRRAYGIRSAWAGAALLSFEPNFAAFIPSAGLDVLAAEGVLFAVWLAWRYFERPTAVRLVTMCVAISFAMLLKHTAVVAPIIIVAAAIVGALSKRLPLTREMIAHAAIAPIIVILAMWPLLLFDISRPKAPKDPAVLTPTERRVMDHRLPGGAYVGSIIMARAHVDRGHPAFLLGQRSLHGWWYYFPVVATYKVPIGVGILVLASIASLALARPRWDELMLLLGFVIASSFFMKSGISIGFRHFLPAYVFLLLLATRCFAARGAIWQWVGWIGVAATAVHGSLQHPNYIAYINFPRHQVWTKISDSNLEWGQSLKQVGRWLESHPQRSDKPVYLAHYLAERGPHAAHYIGNRAAVLTSDRPMPTSGLLIISPTWLVSAYQQGDYYAALHQREPINVIAGSMLVFDLDKKFPPAQKAAKNKHKSARSTPRRR
jgi:hypothetical protein